MASKLVRKGVRFWAVGFKGWVELRTHPTEPRAVRSVLEFDVIGQGRPRMTDDGNFYIEALGPYKKEIKTTAYEGGEVIRVVTTNKFYRITKMHVPMGSMVEVSPAQAAAVKTSKGYGYHVRS